mmetsp:Transcript_5940/g.14681  ORF Transcript_5940/g.14681 Transcript_5940/m.14681 type:complete len:161 (+) Transcript_5940:38-520(+)
MAREEYVGLGLWVMLASRGAQVDCVVAQLEEGGGAEKSGLLRLGDVIESVNGVATKGRGIHEITAMMQGRAGTQATLAVRRPGSAFVRQVIVDRVPVRPFEASQESGIAQKNYKVRQHVQGLTESVALLQVVCQVLHLAMHHVNSVSPQLTRSGREIVGA